MKVSIETLEFSLCIDKETLTLLSIKQFDQNEKFVGDKMKITDLQNFIKERDYKPELKEKYSMKLVEEVG